MLETQFSARSLRYSWRSCGHGVELVRLVRSSPSINHLGQQEVSEDVRFSECGSAGDRAKGGASLDRAILRREKFLDLSERKALESPFRKEKYTIRKRVF